MDYPITAIDRILPACQPSEPLRPDDPRYDPNVATLRHGRNLKPLQQSLRHVPDKDFGYIHRCLCGHRGSGKSTELYNFETWALAHHYLPVRIEVDKRLGFISLEATDLFFLAALFAEEALTDKGLPVPRRSVDQIGRWFAEVVREDKELVHSELGLEAEAQLGGSIFSLVKLLGKFTASLKASSEHARTVRQRLRNYPNQLVDMTNALLREVNETLAASQYSSGLLLIFDSLDRFPPDSIERALFQSSELVRLLACHAIFVVPISLEYERQGPMQDCYGHFVVLPMLALRDKSSAWKSTVADSDYDEAALDTLVALLAKRLHIAHLFDRPEDVRLLARHSGGCLRDLLHLVTAAFGCGEEEDRTLTHDAVRGGIREIRASYKRQLDAEDYADLALIATKRSGEVKGPRLRRLLYNRMALEYLDADEQPWHDIHPLLLEIPELQNALRSHNPLAVG
jgi:hypothetical protein